MCPQGPPRGQELYLYLLAQLVRQKTFWRRFYRLYSGNVPEVESLRTHFEVLGLEGQVLGLDLSLESSKIALTSTRGQHYFFELLKFCRSPEKKF